MAAFLNPKRTTVRLIRAAIRVSEWIAPSVGARVAGDLWFRLPAGPEPVPLPAGGEAFTVTLQGRTVRGHVWGTGPVVYLLHGWGGRGDQLTAFVEPLVDAGHRVVLFDAPSHGASDPGERGPRSTHGVEMGRALDAVAARFGPAEAIVAHSFGAMSTLLALKYGWLSTARLVLVAPMSGFEAAFAPLQQLFGIGPRVRRRLDALMLDWVGVSSTEFDLRGLMREARPVPTLVVHDREDRRTSYADSAALVASLPDARLLSTTGLGHQRVLRDPEVVCAVVGFVTGRADLLPATA